MQLLACQTSWPLTTAGVTASALVSSGNWRWLSIVSAPNTTAAIAVQAMAKCLACRLFKSPPGPSDSYSGVIRQRDGHGIGAGDQHGAEHHEAEQLQAFEKLQILHSSPR